jgi:aspartate ammonia-lyase
MVNQVAFKVIGNDLAVTMAAQSGQLQMNAFLPLILHSLSESMAHLGAAARILADRCVSGITANDITGRNTTTADTTANNTLANNSSANSSTARKSAPGNSTAGRAATEQAGKPAASRDSLGRVTPLKPPLGRRTAADLAEEALETG